MRVGQKRPHPDPRGPKIDRALVINLDSRPERWEAMQLHLARWSIAVQRFPGVDGSIPETYRQLSTFALDEHLGLDTIVVQDDTGFRRIPRFGEFAVTVYGSGHGGHVCPRAFAASELGWEELADRWTGEVGGEKDRGLVCRQWRGLFTEVQNITYQDPGGIEL